MSDLTAVPAETADPDRPTVDRPDVAADPLLDLADAVDALVLKAADLGLQNVAFDLKHVSEQIEQHAGRAVIRERRRARGKR